VIRTAARRAARVILATAAALTLSATATASSEYDRYAPAGGYLELGDQPDLTIHWKAVIGSDGVVRRRYAGRLVPNPTHIAMYGLQQYSRYLDTRDPKARASAIRHAQWFVRNQDPRTGAWRYPFPYRVGGMDVLLPRGWTSAMAQGQAISLLTRVHRIHPRRPEYLRAARRGLAPLEVPVSRGGLLATYRGMPFYEEYPTRPASYTLNGFQFTMLGLADLASLGDTRAKRLYARGERTLTVLLPRYDAGTTTAYHLGHITKAPRPIHQARGYHATHVMPLRAMNHINPNPTFMRWSERWAAYPAMRTTTPVTLPARFR